MLKQAAAVDQTHSQFEFSVAVYQAAVVTRHWVPPPSIALCGFITDAVT